MRTAKDLGAAYVVLTAKHHDGFCLWPTATTEYSVTSSPFRDGKGDLVGEVAEACRRHGIGLGLYLSPWDRNAPQYEDPGAYGEFYLAQLRELCTDYGELVELWFDGAGSAGREYAWDRIGQLIEELQPGAMVFNMGPATIRWVGNEDGLAADPCWYVTTSADLNNYDEDVLAYDQARYPPPECDVSIRTGWFWHAGQEPKSLEHLLAIHDRSIGLGANLPIAEQENTVAKLSGLATSGDGSLEQAVEVALALFCPDRLMFGSDWPIAPEPFDVDSGTSRLLERIRQLSAADQAQILHGTAERVYRRAGEGSPPD
ncbi:alpha-L-fucosidase [Brachybacterium muris]|uniref:alpha-L-fucosidase n=1 Tax=Brachybacterium muris TaxID=219301 RepID=UPI0029F84E87|nr:alpha-L-fucosidase [Brachybacterium muris]MCT1431824.1 alpha-L-fucosidase [Brachybacterium muris]MCT1654284.1 alpha-L-fucosidase [Brachybacterium muris]MCT1998530.1 alpha-L-fucosidase [Brachybacterium muris]MCT2260516.1 alpha-L-fucosidase [Brachybacterium muris]